jgi:hypothetical protein
VQVVVGQQPLLSLSEEWTRERETEVERLALIPQHEHQAKRQWPPHGRKNAPDRAALCVVRNFAMPALWLARWGSVSAMCYRLKAVMMLAPGVAVE